MSGGKNLLDSFRRGFNHRENWNAEADALGYDAAKIGKASSARRIWIGLAWMVCDARGRLSDWIAP